MTAHLSPPLWMAQAQDDLIRNFLPKIELNKKFSENHKMLIFKNGSLPSNRTNQTRVSSA